MIKEMTDMLSTYDRKLEVDQADQEELDLKNKFGYQDSKYYFNRYRLSVCINLLYLS